MFLFVKKDLDVGFLGERVLRVKVLFRIDVRSELRNLEELEVWISWEFLIESWRRL